MRAFVLFALALCFGFPAFASDTEDPADVTPLPPGALSLMGLVDTPIEEGTDLALRPEDLTPTASLDAEDDESPSNP